MSIHQPVEEDEYDYQVTHAHADFVPARLNGTVCRLFDPPVSHTRYFELSSSGSPQM
jgi:hypothetical protein